MDIKLISWNVNGIRAAIKKGLWEKLEALSYDVYSFQETKSDQEIMTSLFASNSLNQDPLKPETWPIVWHSASNRKGYSGVASMWRPEAKFTVSESTIGLQNEKFDTEGRLICLNFTRTNSQYLLTLINAYYPQGGRGPERIAYKLEFYAEVKKLCNELKKQGKKIVLCGDFNTTVTDIDLARPKENRNTTGCLPEEREALNWFLEDGYFDSFRYFYPDLADKYSYWDQITRARERNVGWRIDYFIVDKDLQENTVSADIFDQVMGSDHCPVSLHLKF